MKIQEKDIYHGSALTQIAEDPTFKALNKADARYGHYQVNTNRRLLVKYSKKERTPWQFTFTDDDIRTINDDLRRKDDRTFVVLVCGHECVAILDAAQINEVLDLSQLAVQWVKIELPSGGSMRASGTKGSCRYAVKHKDFPEKIFI